MNINLYSCGRVCCNLIIIKLKLFHCVQQTELLGKLNKSIQETTSFPCQSIKQSIYITKLRLCKSKTYETIGNQNHQ